jgi:hypothetical protein
MDQVQEPIIQLLYLFLQLVLSAQCFTSKNGSFWTAATTFVQAQASHGSRLSLLDVSIVGDTGYECDIKLNEFYQKDCMILSEDPEFGAHNLDLNNCIAIVNHSFHGSCNTIAEHHTSVW